MDNLNEDDRSAKSLKDEGNECIKNGKFKEAALLYTQAIKIEPTNEILYSNRSLSYLKLHLYKLALADANDAIQLNPEWAKGYFRKAEAELAMKLVDTAHVSYEMALMLLPDDPGILEAIAKVKILREKKNEVRKKIPWLCSCVGLILGVTLTILDYTMAEKPILTNPILQVIFIQALAGTFWLIAYTLTSMDRSIFEDGGEKVPRFALILGLILGLVTIIVDSAFFNILAFKDSASRIFFTLIIAGSGWGIGSILRYKKQQTEEIPTEDVNEDELLSEENIPPERTSNKYTKAQARYRYKKGKKM